jgi:hypothetical protein
LLLGLQPWRFKRAITQQSIKTIATFPKKRLPQHKTDVDLQNTNQPLPIGKNLLTPATLVAITSLSAISGTF